LQDVTINTAVSLKIIAGIRRAEPGRDRASRPSPVTCDNPPWLYQDSGGMIHIRVWRAFLIRESPWMRRGRTRDHGKWWSWPG